MLKVEDNNPSFVIVDLNLTDINGFEVIKEIRTFSKVPVIVLSIKIAKQILSELWNWGQMIISLSLFISLS